MSEIEGNMDAVIAAELRSALADVDGLAARYDAAARRPLAAETLAALDNVHPHARFVSIHATQAVSTALDHLNTWRLLFDAGHLPMEAHMTLLRSALEGSVRCRWLLDASIDSTTRVARGYAAKRDDHHQRRRFEESREGLNGDAHRRQIDTTSSGKSASERLIELEAWRVAAAIPAVRYEDATTLMKVCGLERWYRLASAASHGREWGLGAADIEPLPDAGAAAGVGQGLVSARDDVVLALTLVTIRSVDRALGALEAYTSVAMGSS